MFLLCACALLCELTTLPNDRQALNNHVFHQRVDARSRTATCKKLMSWRSKVIVILLSVQASNIIWQLDTAQNIGKRLTVQRPHGTSFFLLFPAFASWLAFLAGLVQFMSGMWKQLTADLGINLGTSSAHRPQTDGQVQRFNKTLDLCISFESHTKTHSMDQSV